jgi:hypothetical protein
MARTDDDDGKPQGRAAGLPYDWRFPTAERVRARTWNPDEPRLWTPKAFGWGYGVNFYWLAHPVRYLRRHRR